MAAAAVPADVGAELGLACMGQAPDLGGTCSVFGASCAIFNGSEAKNSSVVS
jgi:hypothetical protein